MNIGWRFEFAEEFADTFFLVPTCCHRRRSQGDPTMSLDHTKYKHLVIDGRGHLLGRLAAVIAKQVLSGQRVVCTSPAK